MWLGVSRMWWVIIDSYFIIIWEEETDEFLFACFLFLKEGVDTDEPLYNYSEKEKCELFIIDDNP